LSTNSCWPRALPRCPSGSARSDQGQLTKHRYDVGRAPSSHRPNGRGPAQPSPPLKPPSETHEGRRNPAPRTQRERACRTRPATPTDRNPNPRGHPDQTGNSAWPVFPALPDPPLPPTVATIPRSGRADRSPSTGCWKTPPSGTPAAVGLLCPDFLIVVTVGGVLSRVAKPSAEPTRRRSALDNTPPTARAARIGEQQEELDKPGCPV
jgi:hypothetical protein